MNTFRTTESIFSSKCLKTETIIRKGLREKVAAKEVIKLTDQLCREARKKKRNERRDGVCRHRIFRLKIRFSGSCTDVCELFFPLSRVGSKTFVVRK